MYSFMRPKTKIPKGYYKITPFQLRAIIEAANNISSSIGGGDDDSESIRIARGIDRFLAQNGFKRQYE